MFLSILKKDLKRKKTMNIIMLLFVAMTAMFASAAINNMIAVTGGIESYFEKAEVPEAIVNMPMDCEADKEIKALPSVSEVKTEKVYLVMGSEYFRLKGEKLKNFINPAGLVSDKEMGINYFDENNEVIEKVGSGGFYANSVFSDGLDIDAGDMVELEIDGYKTSLEYKGRLKGAVLSSESLSNPYLLVDDDTLSDILKNTDIEDASFNSKKLFVKTSDTAAVQAIADSDEDVYFHEKDDFKDNFMYDMLTAYIMMAISVVLMIAVFFVLKFTITFTITEEFREIGVMKAVGIKNRSIRGLYIVKYFAISVAGAVIGFLGSIPLSSMMLDTVQKNMVFDNSSSVTMGILSSAVIVAVILLFCYLSTGKVKKLSPIDAVRSGQTGERFGKKSILSLGRSRLPSTGFLSLNDVLSAPKQFILITLIFTLCVLVMTIMSNCAMTLKSEKILYLFGVPESDAHIMDTAQLGEIFTDSMSIDDEIKKKEEDLEKLGMPAKCSVCKQVTSATTHADKTEPLMYSVTTGDIPSELVCERGTAPRKADEAAVSIGTVSKLGVDIGDHITTTFDGREYEFIITGVYSSFMPSSVMLTDEFDTGAAEVSGCLGLQIRFDDHPDAAERDRRIAELREYYDTDKIYNTSDMIKSFTSMSDTLNTIKQMMMILTVIVVSMIVILMERSFISKEKGEIALMKAMGIKCHSIIAQHTLRFFGVGLAACAISSALVMPASNSLMSFVCSLIGDVSKIKCDYDAAEIFAVCPAILLAVTVVGAFLTALYTNTIKADDTASIE